MNRNAVLEESRGPWVRLFHSLLSAGLPGALAPFAGRLVTGGTRARMNEAIKRAVRQVNHKYNIDVPEEFETFIVSLPKGMMRIESAETIRVRFPEVAVYFPDESEGDDANHG